MTTSSRVMKIAKKELSKKGVSKEQKSIAKDVIKKGKKKK
jgi:hypothetical protein